MSVRVRVTAKVRVRGRVKRRGLRDAPLGEQKSLQPLDTWRLRRDRAKQRHRRRAALVAEGKPLDEHRRHAHGHEGRPARR